MFPNEHSLELNDYKLRKRKALWTQYLESNNPYNPQWAQLGDLHGAIGDQLVLTRAVVIGSNKNLIMRLLFVLSYFIRCSASCFFDVKQEEFDFETLEQNNKKHTSAIHADQHCSSILSNDEFTNCINDDSQREIHIFDLNSSPIANDALNVHTSSLNCSLNQQQHLQFKITLPSISNGKSNGHSDLSSDISKKSETIVINNHHGDDTCELNDIDELDLTHNNNNHSHKRYYKSKPLDVKHNGIASDGTPFSTLLNKKSNSNNNSYIRSLDSSNDNKNSIKKRHISSNSSGEHCNAQDLPLIE